MNIKLLEYSIGSVGVIIGILLFINAWIDTSENNCQVKLLDLRNQYNEKLLQETELLLTMNYFQTLRTIEIIQNNSFLAEDFQIEAESYVERVKNTRDQVRKLGKDIVYKQRECNNLNTQSFIFPSIIILYLILLYLFIILYSKIKKKG